MKSKKFISLATLALLIVGALLLYFIANKFILNKSSLSSPTVPLKELQAAPDKVTADGAEYTLEAYLWRDFMPIAEPGGGPLNVSARLRSAEGERIAEEIDLTYLWVINGKEVWETELPGIYQPESQDELEKLGTGGPKWGPGIRVDVVVRIVNRKNGQEFLLQAPNQEIQRTD